MAEQLGFGISLRPIRLFIGKEMGALWYTWNEETQQPNPIGGSRLSGYLKAIEKMVVTSEYGVKEKLIVTIEADKIYQIQTGLETWSSKTLLLSLGELDAETLSRIISIEPYSNSNSKVVFLNTYNWQNQPVISSYKWEKDAKGKLINEPNYEQILTNISARLKPKQSDISDLYSPEIETFTDPETGEVIF